jgi:hypothetical protein
MTGLAPPLRYPGRRLRSATLPPTILPLRYCGRRLRYVALPPAPAPASAPRRVSATSLTPRPARAKIGRPPTAGELCRVGLYPYTAPPRSAPTSSRLGTTEPRYYSRPLPWRVQPSGSGRNGRVRLLFSSAHPPLLPSGVRPDAETGTRSPSTAWCCASCQPAHRSHRP